MLTKGDSGKITVAEDEYSLNQDFVHSTLKLADELELDEVETAKLLLEAQGARELLDRSLVERGIIRFHQQRKYLLDCMRLCIQLANDDELETGFQDFFGAFATEAIYGAAVPGGQAPREDKKIIPRCMAAMQDVKVWLQRITEKVTTTNLMYQTQPAMPPEFQEAIEFSRVSLVQQHELLAVIMCSAIEKHQAGVKDFQAFLRLLKKIDRYDHLLGKQLRAKFGHTQTKDGLTV